MDILSWAFGWFSPDIAAYVALVVAVVAAAKAFTKITPSTKDDEFVAKVESIVNRIVK